MRLLNKFYISVRGIDQIVVSFVSIGLHRNEKFPLGIKDAGNALFMCCMVILALEN